jgi:hypothetical protein
VSGAVPPLIKELLSGTRLRASDTAFAMHPGGPKVLHMTAEALELPDAAFEVSWQFLAAHGNTSGSSNLALLHNELHRRGSSQAPLTRHIMCLGIGPGLALEGLLLQRMGGSWQQPAEAAEAVEEGAAEQVLRAAAPAASVAPVSSCRLAAGTAAGPIARATPAVAA